MKISGLISQFALIGSVLALSCTLVSAAPQAGKVEVTLVKGTVSLNDRAAKTGDSMGPGGVITTGASSRAELYLGVNGPTIVVEADTKVTFEELSFDDSGPETVVTTKINLQSGRVSGYVKKTSSKSSYTVTTPTTTAAIRGTTYQVDADGTIRVWEGCVNVKYRDPKSNALLEVLVCAGQMFNPNTGLGPNDEPTPLPPIERPPVSPVGPVINLSPSKPDGNTSGSSESKPSK